MMTPEKRLEELLEHGAAITILFPDSAINLTLGGALWLKSPTRLRWTAIFPEHQGHIHDTRYDEVLLENKGRDIAFFADGERVMGIVPYEEGPLDIGEVREALDEWQGALSNPLVKARFLQSLEEG